MAKMEDSPQDNSLRAPEAHNQEHGSGANKPESSSSPFLVPQKFYVVKVPGEWEGLPVIFFRITYLYRVEESQKECLIAVSVRDFFGHQINLPCEYGYLGYAEAIAISIDKWKKIVVSGPYEYASSTSDCKETWRYVMHITKSRSSWIKNVPWLVGARDNDILPLLKAELLEEYERTYGKNRAAY